MQKKKAADCRLRCFLVSTSVGYLEQREFGREATHTSLQSRVSIFVGSPRKSKATKVEAANLHRGSLVRVGASAGPITPDVIGSSFESSSLQENLGLLVSGAQREFVLDREKWPCVRMRKKKFSYVFFWALREDINLLALQVCYMFRHI